MTRIRSTAATLACAVAVTAGAIGAQAAQTPSPSSGATERREPAATAPQTGRPDTREFITQMTVAGLTEVQLGKLAAERAASPEVKAFGQMMVRDHSRAGDELTKIASELKIEQPKQLDEKHRELVDRLSKLQGAEFDREYMTAMVQGHEGVLGTVKARVGNRVTSNQPAAGGKPTGSEPTGTSGASPGEATLDKWAAKVLPTVQQHLERARAISEKLK